MDAITFEVPGQPVPQPRHKVAARGRFAHAYIAANHPIHAFRQAVQLVARASGVKLTASPVAVDIECVFERPPSHVLKSGRLARSAKPFPPRCDFDNLAKGICDALTGIAWDDDDQVVDGRCRKRYAETGEAARTVITIRRAVDGPPP
jgi:Holliday junction resolvase RusA-like endonuclease